MKTFAMLVAMFFAALTNVYATDIYDDYDAFYATQPGALFNAPLKHEEGKIYSNDGENDIYSNFQEIIGGKTIDILISSNQITVNKKHINFLKQRHFPACELWTYILALLACSFPRGRATIHSFSAWRETAADQVRLIDINRYIF